MKKNVLALALLLMSFLFYMISCKDKSTEIPNVGKPTLDFSVNKDVVSSDATLESNTYFTVGLKLSDDIALSKLEIRVSYDGGQKETIKNITCKNCDMELELNTYVGVFQGRTRDEPGVETYYFKAIDSDGNETEKSIKIQVTKTPKELKKEDGIMFDQEKGATAATYSSISSSHTIGLYNVQDQSDLDYAQKMVDLLYVTDKNGKAVFCVPQSSYTDLIDSNVYPGAPSLWSSYNPTILRKTTITASEFDAMTTSEELIEEMKNKTGVEEVVDVKIGDVFYIKPFSPSSKATLIKLKQMYRNVDQNLIRCDILQEK